MLITKLCKLYIGIGMAFSAYGLNRLKEKDPEFYKQCSLETKVKAFTYSALSWPKPVFKGLYTGTRRAIKKRMEGDDEFDI